MTTLNLTKSTPAKVTGLTIIPAVGGATLKWDASAMPSDKFQVYYNTSNTTSGATLLATVDANQYIATNLSPTTDYFFFVRAVNIFGVVGDWATPWTLGANFNKLYAGVYEFNGTGTQTTSVNYVQAQVWYTTAGGTATSVGPSSFTTTVTNSNFGTTPWANPDNARVNDANYATVTAGDSLDLLFKLSDLGVPDDATVTAIQFTLGGKTTNFTIDELFVYIVDINTSQSVGDSIQFDPFTANSTDQVKTAGSSTEGFGLATSGLKLAQQKITSSNTAAPTAVTTSSTSIGIGGGTASITNYDTWYELAYFEFTAGENDFVTGSLYALYTISSISSSGVQRVGVKGRIRLRNTTDGVDVPAGTDETVLFSTSGSTNFGNLTGVFSISKSFVSGFRGLLIPGKSYRIYIDMGKFQFSGSGTLSLSINASAAEASGAATLS